MTSVRLPVRISASDGTSSAVCALPPNDTVANMPGFRRPPRLGSSIRTDSVRLSAWTSGRIADTRSEEHTSELQSLMRISYAVFCLKNKQPHAKKQNADDT